MIRLLLVRDPISWTIAQRLEVPWSGRETAARLAMAHALAEWGERPRLRVAMHGHVLTEDELTLALGDDVELVIGPDPQGLELVVMLALSLVSMAVSFLAAKLIDLPSDVLSDGARGDESSATNAWDRVHTEYRPGFPVPFAFGEVDVGGTAVHVDIQAGVGGSATGPNEELRLGVALCEGPIRGIGGITRNADDLGALEGQLHAAPAPTTMLPIPADIRVDGNRLDASRTGTLSGTPARWSDTPNARVYTRLGGIPQDPLPAIGPRWGYQAFSGARQTDLVDADLATQGATAVHTIVATEPIDFVSLIIAFPAGLYDASNGALPPQPASVRLQIRWRNVGAASWSSPLVRLITEANLNTFTVTETIHVQTTGPLEIEITRQTAPGGRGIADRVRVRQAVYGFSARFGYPRTAVLGLVLVNGENASGARAQVVTRIQGLLVPVWDATVGSGQPSAAEYWDVPATGNAYHGIWSYPPGRNPAWILAAFLLHPAGAGRWVSASQIDWPAFRAWADFCDQSIDVDGEPEALCQCDMVVDSPTPISEVADRICQAGRASIRRLGNQISVVYQYRDAHGRGTNSVAAKARTQLVSTTNVEGLRVEFLDTFNRPSTILATFRDRERDFAWRTVPVHDPRGGHQDPATLRPIQYRRQAVRFEALSRESQVIREALLVHAANALVRSEISGTLGREALAALPGDWFGVVHDVLRPYDTECFALRTTAASSSAAIALNKALTLVSGRTYRVIVRQTDGTLAERTVTSISGSYAVGATLTLNAAIAAAKAAPVAFGELDKVVVDYELRSISLDQDLRRVFRATEVAPDIHDSEDVGDLLAAAGAALGGTQGGLPRAYDLQDDTSGLIATELALRTLPGRQTCEIAWRRPAGMGTVRARAHVRLAGSERWWSAGETDGDRVEVALAIGQPYDVSVTFADRLGRWQRPGSAALATLTPEEFPAAPPADVSGLAAAWTGRELVLTWDAQPDARAYEVRNVGEGWLTWLGAPLLARVTGARAELELPAIYSDATDLVVGVRAVSADGLLSARPAFATWTPVAPAKLWEIDDVVPDPEDGGFSRSNCTCTLTDSDFAVACPPEAADRSATGGGRGWVESQVFDAGYDVEAWVAVHWEAQVRGLEPVSSLLHRLDSGEAHWHLVEGRASSERAPGIDPTLLVSTLTEQLAALSPRDRCGADAGEAGTRAEARVYLRTARSGETISAQPWVRYDQTVRIAHRYAQLRVELDWINDGATTLDVRRIRMRRYA